MFKKRSLVQTISYKMSLINIKRKKKLWVTLIYMKGFIAKLVFEHRQKAM